jgi:perosamine synthetase
MTALMDLARRHGLGVIEDTAQAHGARYEGRMVGTIGDCAGTSLNQAKNLPGGEGGLFLTNDPELYRAARRLRYLGEDLEAEGDPAEGRRYWCHGLGFNYRAQELPAAFARSQLSRITETNVAARAAAARLSGRLDQIEGIEPPQVPKGREHVFHIYRARLTEHVINRFPDAIVARDAVVRALHAEGVACGIWQHFPLPAHPAFRRDGVRSWAPDVEREPLAPYRPEQFPVSVDLCERSFVIGSGRYPMAVFDEPSIERYADAVEKVLTNLDELVGLGLEPFASNFEPAVDAEVATAR